MLGNVGSLCRRSLPKEPFYVEPVFCHCFLFREKILHQPMFRYAPELKRIGDRKWCTFLHPKTQQGWFRLWRACAREITHFGRGSHCKDVQFNAYGKFCPRFPIP